MTTDPTMTPEEFHSWRLGESLTQQQVGKKFGVSQFAVSVWERKGVPRDIIGRVKREEREKLPEMCRYSEDPLHASCRGKGYCPRDIACNE